MEANQNITLRVPRALLLRIKRLAADRDTSVSALSVRDPFSVTVRNSGG